MPRKVWHYDPAAWAAEGPSPMPVPDWIPIVQRHGRLLVDLRKQRGVDPYGMIGWLGLYQPPEFFTPEQLYEPLLGRAMVEDLQRLVGPWGEHFVRVTDFGLVCLDLGYMPRGRVEAADTERWTEDAQAMMQRRPELDAANPPKVRGPRPGGAS